jgi:hypothetical protein
MRFTQWCPGSRAPLGIAFVRFGTLRRGRGGVAHGRWSHRRDKDRGSSVFEWEGGMCLAPSQGFAIFSLYYSYRKLFRLPWDFFGIFSRILGMRMGVYKRTGTMIARKMDTELKFWQERRRATLEWMRLLAQGERDPTRSMSPRRLAMPRRMVRDRPDETGGAITPGSCRGLLITGLQSP